MTYINFNNSFHIVNNPVQELRDMYDIAEGIYSLNCWQFASFFDESRPPIAVLAQACREALAEEKDHLYSPQSQSYISQYH